MNHKCMYVYNTGLHSKSVSDAWILLCSTHLQHAKVRLCLPSANATGYVLVTANKYEVMYRMNHFNSRGVNGFLLQSR